MNMPIVVFSIKNLSHRIGRDQRTIASRISKFGIEPFAITPCGMPLYPEDVLHRLELAELEAAPQEASL